MSRASEPGFMDEVDRALLAKRPVYLQLDGYESNKDIIAACLWYALDHGLKVVVTSSVVVTTDNVSLSHQVSEDESQTSTG